MRPMSHTPFVQVFILALLRPFFVLQDGAQRDGSTTPAAAALLNRRGCGATDEALPQRNGTAMALRLRCCAVAALLQRRGAPTRLRTAHRPPPRARLQGYGQHCTPPADAGHLRGCGHRSTLHAAAGAPTRLRPDAAHCTLHSTAERHKATDRAAHCPPRAAGHLRGCGQRHTPPHAAEHLRGYA